MKRLLYLFIIGLMAVSCTDSNDDNTNIKIINLSVKSTDWVLVPEGGGLNQYYTCSFTLPEISNWVYNNGVVNVYRTYDTSAQPLPTVLHQENTEGNRWTETIDYEYEPGRVKVFVTNSDFYNVVPGAMTFKVTLIW